MHSKKDKLTLNAVKVNLEAGTQLLISNPFKLLEKPVDCTLDRFMPLNLRFYCNGVH